MDPKVLLIAVAIAASVWAGGRVVRGVKRASHTIHCKVRHCSPPPAPDEQHRN